MSAIRLARGFTGRERIVKFEGCYHGHSDGAARQGGLGRPDARRARFRGRAGRDRGRDDDAALQRRRRARGLLRKGGRRDRLRHRRAGRRQHGLRAAGRGLSRDAARALHAPWRGAHLRRGDDGISRRARRRAGALWRASRTSRRSARSSAAACRSAPLAGGATSWRSSRRSGPCTRPARCPAIRSRWRRDSRRSRRVAKPGFHARLAATTTRLVEGLAGAARAAGIPVATTHVCGMFSLFFTSEPAVTNYRQVMASDAAPLPALLPRHAAGGRLSCALALRGGFRIGGARRGRDRRRPSKPPAACSPRSRKP